MSCQFLSKELPMTLRTLSTALVFGVVILTSSWTQSQENLGKPKAVDKLPSPPQIAQFKDFSDWVTSVAISPDGAIIAAGSYQKVQLIDLATKKTIGTLDSGKGFAKGVAFSPDGTSLAVGGYRTLTLWNVKTQKPVKTLEGHRDYVTSVSFSRDGKLLVSGSDDESVRIWLLPDGQPGPVLSGHLYPVQGVAISPDGALIASAAGDEDRPTKPGEVKLWTMDGKELAALPDHKRGATGVAFSPDGKYLASTGLDEAVNIYRVEDKKALGFFGGHGRPTNAVVFAKDGKTVISAAGGRAKGNNTAMFWLREDGEEKASIETHQARVSCLALSVDGKTLVTGSYDKSVAVWNVSAFSSASETHSPAGPAEAEIPAVASVTRGDMGDREPCTFAMNCLACTAAKTAPSPRERVSPSRTGPRPVSGKRSKTGC